MKNELNSIHDWDLHQTVNAAKVERNSNIRILIAEYLDIPVELVTPNSKLFILGIMASILHEEGIFFKNKKEGNFEKYLFSMDPFSNYSLTAESKFKILVLFEAEVKYNANKTRATYKALFLNYNIKEIEVHIIGLIQKINENSAEINLFDLGNILDIKVEDLLE